METTSIKLQRPLKLDRGPVDTVKIRRPKVRDMEMVDHYPQGIQRNVHMVAHLAELTPDEVRDLDLADFNAVWDEVLSFLEPQAKKNSPKPSVPL